MKTSFNTLIAAMLLASAGTAMAASSVDLTVKGLITPSACTPVLSNGGAVEYGKISAKDLNAATATFLDPQTLQLNVTCDAATLMGLEGKDNREGSDYKNDLMYFGLGLINGSEKLGGMTIRLRSALADGVSSSVIGSQDGGNTWILWNYMGRDVINSVADPSNLIPKPVQDFTADFVVYPEIAPTSGLTLTNEAAIDGSVTLTVRYL